MKLIRKFWVCLVVVFSLISNIPTVAYASENNIIEKSTSEFYDEETGETITVVSVLSSSPNSSYMLRASDEYSKLWAIQLLFYKGKTHLGTYSVQFNHNYSPQRGYTAISGIDKETANAYVNGYGIAGSYDIETQNSIRITATVTNSTGSYSNTLTKKYVCSSSGTVKTYE